MSPVPREPFDDDLLAAEYVLGLLDWPETDALHQRVAQDVAFAALVEGWRERLGTLGSAPVAPPEHLWRGIETRIADNDDVSRDDLHAVARRWRGATAVMSVIAGGLVAALFLRPPPIVTIPTVQAPVSRPSAPPLVASVSGTRGDSLAVAFDRTSGRLLVTPGTLKAGKRDAELWVIPVGATAPVAIGVIDARAPSRLALDRRRAALIVAGATFAVSLEPRGGVPTGAPTGPVVATGKIIEA